MMWGKRGLLAPFVLGESLHRELGAVEDDNGDNVVLLQHVDPLHAEVNVLLGLDVLDQLLGTFERPAVQPANHSINTT